MEPNAAMDDSPKCPVCGGRLPEAAPQGLCAKCLLEGVVAPTRSTTAPGGGLATVPSAEKVAAAFPQLEILGVLGAGGMGVVYKARQKHLDRWVALKVLSESLAASPSFVERFEREARVLARLNHPNIVTLYDFGQAGGFCYLLMEYVDGVNLAQAMRAGRFTPAQALSVVPKVCEALQYAHELGVLHRDIKPANLLLDERGRVKIADFGVAKLVGESKDQPGLTLSGAAVGTPAYMAPEQIETPSTVDHRADIYSLGVVFYEMLTGELPLGRFSAPSEKQELDGRIDAIVMRALKKEREQRQQSADEVRTEVENLAGTGAGVGVGVGAVAGSSTTGSKRSRVWSRVVQVALVVLAAGMVLFVAGGLLISTVGYFWLSKREPVGDFPRAEPMVGGDAAPSVSVPVPVVTKHTGPPTGPVRERLLVQLDLAEKKYAENRKRHEAGVISNLELETSKSDVDVARCLLVGDESGAAAMRLRLAETKQRDVAARARNGKAGGDELREAEAEVRLRQIDWQEAVAKSPNVRSNRASEAGVESSRR